MKKNWKNFFRLTRENSIDTSDDLGKSISKEVISSAFNTRKKEIESLRKYDRGEKTITPFSLKDSVRNI